MNSILWIFGYFLCVLITMIILIVIYKNGTSILAFNKYNNEYNEYLVSDYNDYTLKNKELLGLSFVMGLVWPLCLVNLILTIIVNFIKYIFRSIWELFPSKFKTWLDEEA